MFDEAIQFSNQNTIDSKQSAITKFEEALGLYKEVNNNQGQAYCLAFIGKTYRELGKRNKALDYFNQALPVMREIKDENGEANILHGIGVIYDELNDNQKALEFFILSLPLMRKSGDKIGETEAINNLGKVNVELGNYTKGLEYLNEALPLIREIKNKRLESAALYNIGRAYSNIDEKQKALDFYNQALPISRVSRDKRGEGLILFGIGLVYLNLDKYQEAVKYFTEVLALRKDLEDKGGEASTLRNLGIANANLGKYQIAIDFYLQEVPIRQHLKDSYGESKVLHNIGSMYSELGENEKALDYYNQALLIRKKIGDIKGAALTLNNIGVVYFRSGNKQKAIDYFKQSLPLHREIKNKLEEARTLNNIASIYKDLDEKLKAVEFYSQSLAIYKELKDKASQIKILQTLAPIYSDLGEKQKSIECYNQILELSKEVSDKLSEAAALSNIGVALNSAGESQKSIEYLIEALLLARELKNKPIEATVLFGIGNAYSALGEHQESINYYSLALPLSSSLNKRSTTKILDKMALAYSALGEKPKVIEYFIQSLALFKELGDDEEQLKTLQALASINLDLGEKLKAIEYHTQALVMNRLYEDKDGEAIMLNNIGMVYLALREREKARVEYFEKALPLFIETKNKQGQAWTYICLGFTYMDLEKYEEAFGYYSKALKLSREIQDQIRETNALNGIALIYDNHYGNKLKARDTYLEVLAIDESDSAALNNIAIIYADLGIKEKAFEYYTKSAVVSLAQSKEGEAGALGSLESQYKKLNNIRLSIFFGKLKINKYQALREATKDFDTNTQKSYLLRLTSIYNRISESLIQEGRLDEAIQVLNLYRDQQFFDYKRNHDDPFKQLQLSSRESKIAMRYRKVSDRVAQVGRQIKDLERRTNGSQASQSEIEQQANLKTELATVATAFGDFLKEVEIEFSKPADEEDKVADVLDVREMHTSLRNLNQLNGQKTVAIYTFAGVDNFRVLVLTPGGATKEYNHKIKSADFNQKVLEFYALLQSPTYDSRPLGKELYDIIIPKELEAELKKQNIKTLMWQLDGNLRYIPMAALYDGEKYLAEKYQNVVFTRSDTERLLKDVKPNWTGTGFGSSDAHTVDLLGDGDKTSFSALPGVTAELDSIFRIGEKDKGILNGEVIANKKFTKEAFYKSLKQKRPVVHISSHFAFRPGDDSRSYLLLGDGTALTLSEMKKEGNLFEGVDLLTLSACNTAAIRADANGREIDGFAELAQRLGANSVMATLWQVSDASTPWLMREFYRNREIKVGTTKTEALQQAQLALLYGTANEKEFPDVPKSDSVNNVEVIVVPDGDKRSDNLDNTRSDKIYLTESEAKPFIIDKKKPYAHPYYWSPFVLYGNWR